MGPTGKESPRTAREPRVHLLIPTHTTRHLDACLAAVSWQRVLPASIVVTCDSDEPGIGRLIETTWRSVAHALGPDQSGPTVLHVSRPHQGEARLNQVRNNGLRALDSKGHLSEHDQVIVLDGDTILHPQAIARHAALARRGFELVIPYRLNLTEAQSQGFGSVAVLSDGGKSADAWLSSEAREELGTRQSRYRRHLLLRRLGLAKKHKAKILGGHHAVSVRVLRAVNGYDEGYVGYGYDDDDLSRRIHALRPRVRVGIAVKHIPAFHLWHPTRAPSRPTQAPGYERFREGGPLFAERGWISPAAQPEPAIREIDPQ